MFIHTASCIYAFCCRSVNGVKGCAGGLYNTCCASFELGMIVSFDLEVKGGKLRGNNLCHAAHELWGRSLTQDCLRVHVLNPHARLHH